MANFRGNWDTGQRRNFRRILVVGGGRAGVAAAEELRRQGFGGEIIVMADEPEAPYDRPSCSKGLLTGHKRPRDARMPVQDDLAITWAMDRRAVHLDPAERVVVADTDEVYSYDGLVIATGARPVWPDGWPSGEPGLHALHGLSDAWQLRHALRRARRVAVVGGGLTGCEVAYAVRAMARQCVLIDSKQQLMSRALGEVVGRYVTEEVARDGVELRLGRRFRRLDRNRNGWVLVLDDGSEVVADVVVATIGERPDTDWLAEAGVDVTDGVLCDENLRVVGVEDVVAAGTVARWPNLRYSAKPRRVGQWIMALEQGRAAAAALLRSDHPSRPAALVPRFWSEQFGLRIQVCGEVPTDGSAEMTVSRQRPGRRDTARAGVLVGYHRNGEQIGLVGVNAVRAFTTTARMMLAAPPRLVEPPEFVFEQSAPALPAAPAGHPRMIGAGPAGLASAPVSPARQRFTIEAAPDAVRELAYGAPGYNGAAAPPVPPPGYGPATGPPPGYGPAPGYGPRPGYGPAYGPAPGYGPPPEYGVAPGYGGPPVDCAAPGYDGAAGHGGGYDGARGYDGVPEYGPPADSRPPAYDAPVSPGRPTSPPPWGSPRDRFSTDQFAAVR
jgi:NADPH-dependent 2,4-dienoyl-CoA reductase/sulfur reductase-like enzyme